MTEQLTGQGQMNYPEGITMDESGAEIGESSGVEIQDRTPSEGEGDAMRQMLEGAMNTPLPPEAQAQADRANALGRERLEQPELETASDEEEQMRIDTKAFGFLMHRDLINDVGKEREDESIDRGTILRSLADNANKMLMVFPQTEIAKKRDELQKLLQIEDPDEQKDKLNNFLDEVVKLRKKNFLDGKVEVEQEVESIQGLARFIMERGETELYGLEGRYKLLERKFNPESGEYEEIFQPGNFLIWIMDQIIQLHDDNRAGEMKPLEQVAIHTRLSNISIYLMNRQRGQYFKDEKTGHILNELADTAVNICFLFGFFRNMDVGYDGVMQSDEKLPDAIAQIHAKNDLTHDTNWADFLSTPAQFGKKIHDENGEGEYGDTTVGDATLYANDIYRNLADLEELEKIVGKNSPLFTKEGVKKALLIAQKKFDWEEADARSNFYSKESDEFYIIDEETKIRKPLFDAEGNIIKKTYLEFLDFYNAPTPNKSTFDVVREMVRLSIAEKTGLETGYSRNAEESLEIKKRFEEIKERVRKERLGQTEEYIDVEAKRLFKIETRGARVPLVFAEYSSFIEQRPLMVAARQDFGTRGYDAATKLNQGYILGQSRKGTKGPIGNPEITKMQIYKNFGVDLVRGLRTEGGRSPEKIFLELREVMNNEALSSSQKQAQKEKLLGELRFKNKAASDYTSNGVARAFQLFHMVTGGEELGMEKFVTKDVNGIHFHTKEMEDKFKDGFLKKVRYAFSSNAGLDFGETFRTFDYVGKDGMPVFSDKTLAEHMFGNVILDDIRMKVHKGINKDIMRDGVLVKGAKLTFSEYVRTRDGRANLAKNVVRAHIAAEIREHRKRQGTESFWNGEIVNKYLMALRKMPALERDPDNLLDIFENDEEQFFLKEDIKWIRKVSGTEMMPMFLKESAGGATLGFFGGLIDSIKSIGQSVVK